MRRDCDADRGVRARGQAAAERLLVTAWVAVTVVAARARARGDRGDVPGWVLITVMTAGLVGILWVIARDRLQDLLRSALSSVTG